MHIGVAFPTTEIGSDPAGVRAYVRAAEDMGYDYLDILDHVVGADPQFHPELGQPPFTHRGFCHESLTLMGYIAAITQRLKLVTSILILPQR